MAGCCCAEACTAAVLICVIRLPGCPFDSAWCLVCEVCQLTVYWVDCRCFLSFVFLAGARSFELSPCNTKHKGQLRHKLECYELPVSRGFGSAHALVFLFRVCHDPNAVTKA